MMKQNPLISYQHLSTFINIFINYLSEKHRCRDFVDHGLSWPLVHQGRPRLLNFARRVADVKKKTGLVSQAVEGIDLVRLVRFS